MPTTGRATYRGIVIGRAAGASGNRVYTVSGSITFLTDYAAGTFSGSVTLGGVDDRTGETVNFGTFPISSTTSYAAPLNSIIGKIGSNDDNFRAYLAGPSVEELEGSFLLTVPDPLSPGVTLKLAAAAGSHR